LKKTDLELEFELKLKEYKLLIYKVCRIYANDPNNIQELYQDIIIQLWKSYPKFRGESKFSTWLYRIAINTALISLSKPKRSLQYSDVELNNVQVPDEDDIGLKDEQQEQLYLAIQQLNDIEKSIVMLYLEDKSYDEMEDILGISNATLRVKMNRIKEKLRTLTNNK
jgi:RNA polymerase sigma-70 factor (ECF subfamily)